MSKSVLLKSSIAKKYWMALTGLFLCTFLIGHLLGNLQLFAGGEEGKRAFNEYGYFMTHNMFIKALSYLTYISILFHAVDGFLLAYQNRKARPVNYAYNKPSTNSSWASRSMALLGSIILIFICTHMANFWWKIKMSSQPVPLHKAFIKDPSTGQEQSAFLLKTGQYVPTKIIEANQISDDNGKIITLPARMELRHGNEFYDIQTNLKQGEGYKDMYSLVYSFFGQDRQKEGFVTNPYALLAVILYTVSMITLGFHLWHGFSSAFQSLGLRHPKYTPIIKGFGRGFAVLVPLAFAAIPIFIYLTK